jgi:hypothetical protein
VASPSILFWIALVVEGDFDQRFFFEGLKRRQDLASEDARHGRDESSPDFGRQLVGKVDDR